MQDLNETIGLLTGIKEEYEAILNAVKAGGGDLIHLDTQSAIAVKNLQFRIKAMEDAIYCVNECMR